MIDFSLTEADERLLDMARDEVKAAQAISRDIDRIMRDNGRLSEEQQQELRRLHESVADTPSPDLALKDETAVSGKYITEALISAVGGEEFHIRKGLVSFGIWMLRDLGTPEQIEAYGHYSLGIAVSEPGAGADPSAIRSHAKYDAATNEYILNGEKTFTTGINHQDGALALIKGETDEYGRTPFHYFVVLKDTPGISVSPPMRKLGKHYHDIGGFSMHDVRLPALAKVNGDFGSVQIKFNHNRPLVAADGLGYCRSILDFTHAKLAERGITVDYAKSRVARSALEDELIRLEALWEAAWGVVMRVKWLEEQHGEASLDWITESSMAKALGGTVTRQITQSCMEMLGPEGLSEEYLAEKWFRDSRIIDIYEGPGEVHRLTVARKLLQYRKGELD